jgi:hypothetical protein
VLRSIISQFWRGFAYLIFLSIWIEVALQGFYYATAGDFLFRRVAVPIYAREPYAGFQNRPGLLFDHRTNEFHAHYYINQAGFRVPRSGLEYSKAKPLNTYRIMILGPSFAFGWGVEYELSFAALLQQLLQERSFAGGKQIEIINAGIPAMPIVSQLAWFEQVGKDYEPDFVIQFVYGSMAIGSVLEYLEVDDQGYLVGNSTASERWRARLKKIATVFYSWELWTSISRWWGPPVAVLGAGRQIAAVADFDPAHSEVRESMYVYNRLAGIVHATGARLLIVYFPLSYVIHREDESRWYHLGISDVSRQMAFDAAFVRYLNDGHIPSINITEQLHKSASNRREPGGTTARKSNGNRRVRMGGEQSCRQYEVMVHSG